MFRIYLKFQWALNLWSSVLFCLCIFSFWASASDFQMIWIQISVQQTNVNSRIQISNRIQKSNKQHSTLTFCEHCPHCPKMKMLRKSCLIVCSREGPKGELNQVSEIIFIIYAILGPAVMCHWCNQNSNVKNVNFGSYWNQIYPFYQEYNNVHKCNVCLKHINFICRIRMINMKVA